MLCEALGLPPLPDISGIDPDGQEQFLAMFVRLRSKPNDPDEYGLLGHLYAGQQFPDLAIAAYERAMTLDPGAYEWPYAAALQLESRGDTTAAGEMLTKASTLNSEYAPAWMRLAWLAVEAQQLDDALAHVERYIQLRPDDSFGYVQRAQILHDQGKLADAQPDLEKALTLGSIGAQGHRLLGALHHELNRPDDANFHLMLSQSNPPGGQLKDDIAHTIRRLETYRDADLVKFRGLIDAGRYKDALAMADQLLKSYDAKPDLGSIHGSISECYRHLGDYRSAFQHAERACTLNPDKPEPYVSKALALLFGTRDGLPAALQAANRALELDASMITARYARGLILLQFAVRGQAPDKTQKEDWFPQAVADLKACVDAKPVQIDYVVALGTAYGVQERFEDATEMLIRAHRLAPDDPKVEALLNKARNRENFKASPTSP